MLLTPGADGKHGEAWLIVSGMPLATGVSLTKDLIAHAGVALKNNISDYIRYPVLTSVTVRHQNQVQNYILW